MSKIGIAGLQLEAINGDNVDAMEEAIDAVMKRYSWVDMLVLGELNAYGGDRRFAQEMPGPFEDRFGEIAKRNDVWLIPGSILERCGNDTFNTTPVINPDGEVIARYRKQFAWLPYEKGLTPGSDFVVFDVPDVGRFGVSICYDMWFQETLRTRCGALHGAGERGDVPVLLLRRERRRPARRRPVAGRGAGRRGHPRCRPGPRDLPAASRPRLRA
jgi:predicted amidohydrolase